MAQEAFDWDGLVRTVRADYPALYRNWFEQLPVGKLEGGELRITARDPSWANYLRQHCAQAFADSAMGMTGRLITVSFVAGTDQPASIRARPSFLTGIPLHADYTFDEFVVGPSNRLAHAACRGVCSQPGTLYNPLFLHGASGLGKTHLLHATCADLLRAQPGGRIIFISCDAFINDYVRAIETGELQSFHDTCRHCDALLIDDVQFLAKRESSQEELFHTFNALYQAHKQIILSADFPPQQIPTLEDRLISRFGWGLVAQIDPPNREMRQAILQKKARLRGVEIPADVLDYAAERICSNIRVLEGALTTLVTAAQVTGETLTIERARELLASMITPAQRPLLIQHILQAVAQHFGMRVQDLLGRRRTRSISHPRHVAMYLTRRLTNLSLNDIGKEFGDRDHSTILHAEQTIEAECAENSRTAETIALLRRQLQAR